MPKTDKARERAEILIEALPYINKYRGAYVIIKYGGHAMVDEELKKNFAQDMTLLKYVGLNPVVVHGGGPQINELLERLNIRTHFVEGQRFTDAATMDVVEMVLSGKIGKEIAGLINQVGGRAVGLSGKDVGLIRAKRKSLKKSQGENLPPEIIDIGQVGEPVAVDADFLRHMSDGGVIPVIAPVGVGDKGETYNINADLVAGAVAGALKAQKLILLTDVEGVLDKNKKLLTSLRVGELAGLKENGTIQGGMIPKLECCRKAVEQGCAGAYIVDGRTPHAVLLELMTDSGCGTEVLP